MIGVDTNVLLRLLMVDDPLQNRMAVSFFAKRSPEDPAHVSLVVLAEFAWVLVKKYKLAYPKVATAIRAMLDSSDFVIDRRDVVEWALDRYTRSKVDFSDLLIVEANRSAGCSSTVTFDRDAARFVPGMELLK